jgi:hypothetical protein
MTRALTTNPERKKRNPMPAQAVTGLIGTASVSGARSADYLTPADPAAVEGASGDVRRCEPPAFHSRAKASEGQTAKAVCIRRRTGLRVGAAGARMPAGEAATLPPHQFHRRDASPGPGPDGRAIQTPTTQGRIARRRPGPPHEFSGSPA